MSGGCCQILTRVQKAGGKRIKAMNFTTAHALDRSGGDFPA